MNGWLHTHSPNLKNSLGHLDYHKTHPSFILFTGIWISVFTNKAQKDVFVSFLPLIRCRTHFLFKKCIESLLLLLFFVYASNGVPQFGTCNQFS
ncbi:hypothetical protein BLOT_011212, partial [Blomia tropicalis]